MASSLARRSADTGDEHQPLAERLIGALRMRLGQNLAFVEEPRPLAGGAFSELYGFRLSGAPAGWEGPLILRRLPWPGDQARTEAAVQEGARQAGIAAPRVLLLEAEVEALGVPFMVMPRLPGRPFLGGIAWHRFARDFPRFLRRWPGEFARVLDALAAADLNTVVPVLDAYGVDMETVGTARHLRFIEQSVPEDSPYRPGVEWLSSNQPAAPSRTCLVHGDLWATNVFIKRRRLTGLIDWTTGAIGDPALDVGFATLGLALMPEPFPPPTPIRQAIRAAGVNLARRIIQRCGVTVGGEERVAYYQALRCLLQVTIVRYQPGRAGPDPWERALPALIGHFNRVSGLALPPAPPV